MGTFSDSDATRIINALSARSDRKYKDGALLATTWGTVCSISADGKTASAYLYGETDSAYASDGFRVPEAMYLTIGDKVKTAINYQTGERWIYESNFPPTTYKKIAIDLNNGVILTGDGTQPPVQSPSLAGIDFLVGTASSGLSAEIVVGTSPGGELGGTWSSPTVDATHSGSTHAATQAAAEATASGALSTHVGAADPHTGYQKESEKDANSGYAGLDSSGNVTKPLLFGGDTNLYRASASLLKTDDTIAAANTLSAYEATPAATACATSGQYYAAATTEVSFTPAYTGQRWLITLNGWAYWTGLVVGTYNLRITDSSNGTIYDLVVGTRGENAASGTFYHNMSGSNIWVADGTAARKAKLYVATTGTSVTITHGVLRLSAYALP